MIPKIIHTIAHEDKAEWHPIWEKCYNSWFLHFNEKEFEYKMWNDNDLTKLIKADYPQFFDFYQSLPHKIMKFDIARLLIIHKFGGIYHDMDYFCYQNFFETLKTDEKQSSGIFVVEAEEDYHTKFEKIQNSLICSSKHLETWIDVVKISKKLFSFFSDNKEKFLLLVKNPNPTVLNLTGPNFLFYSLLLLQKLSKIYFLDASKFNPNIFYYDDTIFVKHLNSGFWYTKNKRYYDEKKKHISCEEFDFYKNYYNKVLSYS